jgi:hypothetical protein
MRDAAHDEVAIGTLHCTIPYANKTENWGIVLEILESALPIATGQPARERIQENITAAQNNKRKGVCWFCQENPAAGNQALGVKMYGDVERTPTYNGTRVTWRHTTVEVPRCTRCQALHAKAGHFATVLACLGVVVAIVIAIGLGAGGAIGGGEAFLLGVPFAILLGTAGAHIGKARDKKKLPPNVRPVAAKDDYPLVKELRNQGWQFGEKPSE